MVEETENKELTNEEVSPQVDETPAAPVEEEAPAAAAAASEGETTTESEPVKSEAAPVADDDDEDWWKDEDEYTSAQRAEMEAMCDTAAANAQAFDDQAALIARHGGRAAALALGAPGATPPPTS